MPATIHPRARRTTSLAAVAVVALVTLAGCSSTQDITKFVDPYKHDVVQGNFVSKEQVDALQAGMSRQQVRDILGTPLVTDVFHGDRWDYVFTLMRQGAIQQSRKFTVFFNKDGMDRVEGDEMPSEAEFVATLDNRRKDAKVPVLEASEESLKKFSADKPAAASAAAASGAPAADTAPVTVNYPPLEPAQ